MPSSAFSSQLTALHWLINTATLCAAVRQRVPFWATCLLDTYLMMLPSDTGGTHPQNRWERRTGEDDSWHWRYHRTLTSGMLLQPCQETLAEASTVLPGRDTHEHVVLKVFLYPGQKFWSYESLQEIMWMMLYCCPAPPSSNKYKLQANFICNIFWLMASLVLWWL